MKQEIIFFQEGKIDNIRNNLIDFVSQEEGNPGTQSDTCAIKKTDNLNLKETFYAFYMRTKDNFLYIGGSAFIVIFGLDIIKRQYDPAHETHKLIDDILVFTPIPALTFSFVCFNWNNLLNLLGVLYCSLFCYSLEEKTPEKPKSIQNDYTAAQYELETSDATLISKDFYGLTYAEV
ncbi:MAG: hypothetical protein SFT93_00495 [Rickettsiaceae bacterium]|nr:hypothetical protein [Rickettsiaceae bacterium]